MFINNAEFDENSDSHDISRSNGSSRRRVIAGVAAITGVVLVAFSLSAYALGGTPAAPTSVDLGTAANFSVLAQAAATIPASKLPGQVGAQAAITDDANTVYGSLRHLVNDAATQKAVLDARAAYDTLKALTPTGQLTGDDLGGQTITPGVYHRVAAFAETTPVTFDAQNNANQYFIMQSDAAMNTTASINMKLVNGADASHIFWVLTGAATLGASSTFIGTILSYAAITAGAGTQVCGRALSVNAAVTLDANTFCEMPSMNSSLPIIAIDGGSTASTSNQTPTITGTTNADVGAKVTVTVAGQTLTAIVTTGGIWKVIPTRLPNGVLTLVASVTTAAGTGTATQSLTVTPTIAFIGGPEVQATNSTPEIKGTTNAAPGALITVKIAGLQFTTHVTANSTWTITTSALADARYAVTATVADPTGNEATVQEYVTVGSPTNRLANIYTY